MKNNMEPSLRLQKLAMSIMERLIDQHWRLVAIVINHGKIISIMPNLPLKSHPLVNSYNPKKKIHAEINTYLHASIEKMKGSILYVFRLCANGKFGMAKPCEMCYNEAIKHGIKRIVFTTENGFGVIKI